MIDSAQRISEVVTNQQSDGPENVTKTPSKLINPYTSNETTDLKFKMSTPGNP